MIRIITGDCREELAKLPPESVHCCVTSPPYLGLRDYQCDGQIGLEDTLEAYVETMVAVFREVRRVLRNDGTVFLNLGDSYANSLSMFPQNYMMRKDLTNEEIDSVILEMFGVRIERHNQTSKGSVSKMLSDQIQGGQIQGRSSVAGERIKSELSTEPREGAQADNRTAPSAKMGSDRETGREMRLLRRDLGGISDRRPHQRGRSQAQESINREHPSQLDQDLQGHQATGVSEKQIQSPVLQLQLFDRLLGILSTHAFAHDQIPDSVRAYFRKSVALKPKDLMMIPARVALALQADGWWLRSDIIWAKPNPMPESVTDRPTSAHEHVFLLAKSGESTIWKHRDGGAINVRPAPDYRWVHKETGEERKVEVESDDWRRINLWRGQDYYFDAEAVREPVKPGTTGECSVVERQGGTAFGADGKPTGGRRKYDEIKGANIRNVWTIATAPFSEAHFATFPPKLVEPCIKAGTSEKGCCAECGAPWVREVESKTENRSNAARAGTVIQGKGHVSSQVRAGHDIRNGPTAITKTLGWSPSCACNAACIPATVLDPFGGAGTTGLVADRLGRDAILIELNPDYAGMARRRIEGDSPLFAEVGH